MIKIYRKIIAFIVLVLFCTAFIFSNSLKNSEESHKDSAGIVEFVEEVADKIVPNNEVDWNCVVRKGAHLFEFFVLGIVTLTLFLSSRLQKKRRNVIIGAFTYVVLIAFADEFIQRFTGRSSRFSDVIIDVLGPHWSDSAIGLATETQTSPEGFC